MEKNKKHRTLPFSNLSVRKKFLLIDLMVVLAVALIWGALLGSISKTKEEKYRQMEVTAVTATDQLFNASMQNVVAAAKNIYTNEAIYEFLNKRYSSSAEYYEKYYPLQRSTNINVSDTSIVKSCRIYTANPTILTGGDIYQLEPAKSEYWYQYFVKSGKSTVLFAEPDSGVMILVRKLDYLSTDEGESYVCVEVNTDIIRQLADNIGFDGELYIMCGSNLLYSSDRSAQTADDVDIGSDFECITRNYYTADIEFYSYAGRSGFRDFLSANRFLLSALLIVGLLVASVGQIMAINIRRRIRPAISEYKETGYIQNTKHSAFGKDEIGRLLNMCWDMSEKLRLKGTQYKKSSASLMRRNSDYESLFATAMRLDAELAVAKRLPDIKIDLPDENFPLSVESTLLHRTADKFGARYIGDKIDRNEKWIVPAYSLVLIAEDFFQYLSGDSVQVDVEDNKAVIIFRSEKRPRSTDVIKLNAIFEEEVVADDYSFDRDNRFNPYLRIRHCLGGNVSLRLNGKNRLDIIFTITFDSDKGE